MYVELLRLWQASIAVEIKPIIGIYGYAITADIWTEELPQNVIHGYERHFVTILSPYIGYDV